MFFEFTSNLSRLYIYIAILIIEQNNQSFQLNECNFDNNNSNPCVNGICLTNDTLNQSYQCYCFNGYTGVNCSTRFDQCLHNNPCHNSMIWFKLI